MKLKLVSKYNYQNLEGQEIEILDIEKHSNFASGIRCLAKLVGKNPTWLTIDWFCKPEQRPTKRASDGLESPAKNQPSAAGVKSPTKKRKVTSRA